MKKQGLSFLILALALTSCADKPVQKTARNQYNSADQQGPLVDPKYHLAAAAPLNNPFPDADLAPFQKMFAEAKIEPSSIREKFDEVLHHQRELFDKDMTREREKFTEDERKVRENFLKQQTWDRESFLQNKPTPDQRADFFSNQDEKRRQFFADTHEKRDDYEAGVRERRRSFEDYIREKQNSFNQDHRAYTKKFEDLKKKHDAESGGNAE